MGEWLFLFYNYKIKIVQFLRINDGLSLYYDLTSAILPRTNAAASGAGAGGAKKPGYTRKRRH